MAATLDPRRHPVRPDLAGAYLKTRVHAERYAEPAEQQAIRPVVNLYSDRDCTRLGTQLLLGERFDVYEDSGDLAWGQCKSDGYIGYADRADIGALSDGTLQITARQAHLYTAPDFKSLPRLMLPFGAKLPKGDEIDGFYGTAGGFVCKQHVAALGGDVVSVAERFLGAPYLWGGRSSFGIDCSALVQLACLASDIPCPRDSDMQEAELGTGAAQGSGYLRGDLLFWKGHVALVRDTDTLIHANAHHMAVAFEPIKEAIDRIAKMDGPVTSHKRL